MTMRRVRITVALVVACVALLSACSSSSQSDAGSGGPLPIVDQIAPAITALEATLGGPQDYVEINADAQMVSLITYDATASQAQAYRYLQGVLTPASEPFEISGGTPLRAEWITFDPEIIFDILRTELPTSTVVGFVILAGPSQTATYEALLQSRQGGQILVTLGPQGQVLSVQPL
jgi:hypothetical protein